MIVMIAVAALLQQETAEETFKRLEQSVLQAKSLSIKCRLDLAQGDQKATATGVLLLKETNRMKVSAVGAFGDPWAVSDGKKLTVDPRQGLADGAEFKSPKDLNAFMATAMLRKGFVDLPMLPRRIQIYGLDLKERLKLSDFKFGEKDGDLQTLTYVLQEGSGKVEITIWYDPKSLALKKRTWSFPSQKAAIAESYEEFTLNGEIPDEKFKP